MEPTAAFLDIDAAETARKMIASNPVSFLAFPAVFCLSVSTLMSHPSWLYFMISARTRPNHLVLRVLIVSRLYPYSPNNSFNSTFVLISHHPVRSFFLCPILLLRMNFLSNCTAMNFCSFPRFTSV